MYHTIGSNYEATKDVRGSDLVKLIKEDLRSKLPKEYKVLARKETYAGGWTIHSTIKNTGIEKYDRISYGIYETSPYRKLQKQVQDIVDSYNFNDNDSMSDYYHVRFYSEIRVEKS